MGWKARAPKLVSERRALKARCGARCFLQPGKNAFPVCAKRSTSCKPDCGGLRAAFARAKQTRRPQVAKAAVRKACRLGCPWTKSAKRCAV